MNPRLVLAALLMVAGCDGSPPIDTATGQPLELHWSCPREGTVVYYKTAYAGTEKTDKTRWFGPDESNPDVCLKADGTRSLFGRWNLAHLVITSDEDKQFRASMADFLHGKANNAHFITRTIPQVGVGGVTAGNEQTISYYNTAGLDDINVDGHKIKAVRVHADFVYAGDGSQRWADLWLDRTDALLLRADYMNGGSHGNSSYDVTHVDSPIPIKPELLDVYAGTYRNKANGSVIEIKRERDHLVTTGLYAKPQPEYPYTDHDFYFFNYRGQTSSFVTNARGAATQIIHRGSGKPDEVFDRGDAEIAQN